MTHTNLGLYSNTLFLFSTHYIVKLQFFFQFVGPFNTGGSECPKNPEENSTCKRRGVGTQDIDGECLDTKETESTTDNSGDGTEFITLLYTYVVLGYRIIG